MPDCATPPDTPEVPGFKLLKLVGKGASGEVWTCRNETDTSFSAVKIVSRGTRPEKVWYRHELKALRKYARIRRKPDSLLDIKHVAVSEDKTFLYYTTPVADGIKGLDPSSTRYQPLTLKSRVAGREPMPPAEAAEIAARVADALKTLHEHGLLHRDVKPDNIIFCGGRAVLADIGLVTETKEDVSLAGTPRYMEPGQKPSVRTDLYALGKVLYEMANGKDPECFPDLASVQGDSCDIGIFRRVNDICMRACGDESERYDNASQMLEDLRRVTDPDRAQGEAQPKPVAGPAMSSGLKQDQKKPKPLHKPQRHWKSLAFPAAAAALAAILLGARMYSRWRMRTEVKNQVAEALSIFDKEVVVPEQTLDKMTNNPAPAKSQQGKQEKAPAPVKRVAGASTDSSKETRPEQPPPMPPVPESQASLNAARLQQCQEEARSAYAGSVLSRIAMAPEVTLSPQLIQSKASVRVAGRDYQLFHQSWTNRQWRTLLGLISKRELTGMPDTNSIDEAAARLREKEWSIVATVPGVTNGVLLGLAFDTEAHSFLRVWREWETHPDGRSFVHEWTPSAAHIALMGGDAALVFRRADGFLQEYRKRAEDLKRLENLGEITPSELRSRLAALQLEIRQRACKWAGGDAENEIARIRDLNRRERNRDADILNDDDVRLMNAYGLDVWLAREKRRKLGQGEEAQWNESWEKYWKSMNVSDIDAMFGITPENIPHGFSSEDIPPKEPKVRLLGSWKLIRVEGEDTGPQDYTPTIGFAHMNSASMTFVGPHDGKTRSETVNGTYEIAGAALHMEMPPVMEGKGRFVIWHEGPNLIMQQFGSRWTLARVKE